MEALISRSEFEARLAELCLKSGLAGFPSKNRDQHILLKSVVLTLNETSEYSESEIDDRLIFWLSDIAQSIDFDHVSLRRGLVDEGYLQRDKSGTVYRVSDSGPRQGVFDADIDGVDVYEFIGASMKLIQRRKEEYSQRQTTLDDASGSATA